MFNNKFLKIKILLISCLSLSLYSAQEEEITANVGTRSKTKYSPLGKRRLFLATDIEVNNFLENDDNDDNIDTNFNCVTPINCGTDPYRDLKIKNSKKRNCPEGFVGRNLFNQNDIE